tara:strand:+ start:60 stop:767 length:708 start_codon:yes stop_codon:yes gene_type:complete
MVNKAQSWLVHIFTASGAFAGFLSLQAILNDNVFLAFLWLSVAFFIDGIDGSLARYYKVKENVPFIEGSILDNIIDYLNYVFIPSVMLYWFDLVPPQLSVFSVALILIVSCYTFSNTKLKTEDYFFRGFPAVWNIVLFYLFVVETSQWINFTVIIFFSVMTFIPFEYIHPFRVKEKKYLNLFITFIWGLCCLLLLIDLRDTLSPFSAYREIYFWLWVVLNLYFLTFTIKRSITVK